MKRFFTRWFLLNKRLFKKPVFLLILCMVPVLIVALNMVTARTGGFVSIALAAEDPADPLAQEITAKLTEKNGAVHVQVCDSADAAAEMVRYGEADGAWIISADVEHALDELVRGNKNAGCIKIIERKETIALKLAREKLASALSDGTCFAMLCDAYSRKVSPDFDKAELRRHYDEVIGSGELFEFRYASGEKADYGDASFLMLPIRGMLAAAILLAGFAMAMFRIRDDENRVFVRIPRAAQPAFDLGYHLTGIVDVALAVLVSMYAAGIGLSFLREITTLAICCLNCAVFVILIRLLLRKAGSVAAATPMILVIVIVVNPVLFNLPFVYPLRVVTPIYTYLQAAHNAAYLWYGLIYFAVVGMIDLLLFLCFEKTRKHG